MNSKTILSVKRALISVSDKSGVVDFAQALHATGAEIVSTGGTAKALSAAGIPVTQVSDVTEFPEMMGGRVKTLHPAIHGGILARESVDDAELATHKIQAIDLVAVNLYPFTEVVADNPDDLALAIENIDIGGPAMIRAAAKNYASTCVVVEASDYQRIQEELQNVGGISEQTRFELAAKAFALTARYDTAIAGHLAGISAGADALPENLNLAYVKTESMRYGENPHQAAAYYVPVNAADSGVLNARLLQGKPLSYNNVADTDGAIACIQEFTAPSCVIIKHATPCGVATADGALEAYRRAFETDPVSAFGGIIALNRPLDSTTAQTIIDNQFVEVIAVPEVEDAALEVLAMKKNIRVLEMTACSEASSAGLVLTSVAGGILAQTGNDQLMADELTTATRRQPTQDELRDLNFAWKVVKHVKSNAIVYAKDLRTMGVGSGQSSRVDSARIACLKAADAKFDVTGSVMASDAFMPFRDTLDTAAKAGVRAVIQPGGSMRDNEVIEAADEHDIAMVFTGMRHFRH